MLFLLWVMSPKKNATPKVIPNPSNSESIHSKKIAQPKKSFCTSHPNISITKKNITSTPGGPKKPVISGVMGWPKINGFHWCEISPYQKRGPQFITIGSDVHLPHHRSPTPRPNRRHPRLPRSPPLGDPLDFQRRRP